MAAESSAMPGKYSTKITPWVPGMLDALDDRSIYMVVCMKSAQVAWTDGVINNWLGRIIDIDPSPVIGMFAKSDSAKEYAQEKLGPMVRATPRLRKKMDVETSRKDGNRAMFKKFAGGFLKLVGSNSVTNAKSTPSPRVFVEEPDDANTNVGNQGDSIKLLEERTKTFPERKIVFGGTPSIKGLSTIERAYQMSDQRKFYIPCHECGDEHVLHWSNVSWLDDKDRHHEILGHAVAESAAYVCPHCGSPWNDHQKNRNVRKGHWVATATAQGVAGFYINELYSPFPGSTLQRLVERYLEAQHSLEQGDESDMIVFTNSAIGLPYEYESNAPKRDELMERAQDYAEMTVPDGGLILTAGVDVQGDGRLAIVIRAWGRGEESWLVYWGEIYANTNINDTSDPVWQELDKLLFTPIEHARGFKMMIQSITIDSSDGNTSDTVYHWVRGRQRKGVMAGKGSSHDYGTREIYSLPRKADHRTKTKASKWGLQIYQIGTHKAKDLLIGDRGRITLAGNGPGRMHFYRDVRQDYFDQLTGEVKAPHRGMRGKLVWQPKSGQAVEALDCEVYALHAARAIKVHTKTEAQWQALENTLQQADLFTAPEQQKQKQQPAPQQQSGGDWIKRGDGDWIK